MSARAPFPRTAEFDGERLVAVGGVDAEDLAATQGTPLYVVDRAELVGRMRTYLDAFAPDGAVAYAAKALCVVGVLQLAAAEGLHVDVASAGELATATAAGFPMDRVLLHGNNKSPAELARAVELGVDRIVVDSFRELDLLVGIAKEADRRVGVLLRITPGVIARTHAFIATGHDDSKFGFTLSAGLAHEAAARAVAAPQIHLRGLHCHIGSQVAAADAFDEAARTMVGLLADLRERHGIALDELNLGGGLGIAYTAQDDAPAVEAYAAALHAAVAREAARRRTPAPRLFVEPGRSIAGPSGITLYRVGTVKRIPGVRTYVSVDGGMSDNPRPVIYGARYTFAAAGHGTGGGGTRPVTVAGVHCEAGDVLARDVALPAELVEGDLLAVASTGAYAFAMASNYNRVPRPAMVLVGDGRVDPLVRRETVDDLLAADVPLPAAGADQAGGR